MSGLTHTEILCDLSSGYPSVEKAALELCILFFIFTEETLLAQLCSHCKHCCFSILVLMQQSFLYEAQFFCGQPPGWLLYLIQVYVFHLKKEQGKKLITLLVQELQILQSRHKSLLPLETLLKSQYIPNGRKFGNTLQWGVHSFSKTGDGKYMKRKTILSLRRTLLLKYFLLQT